MIAISNPTRVTLLVICCASAMLSERSLAQQPDTAKLLETATSGSGQARFEAIDQLGHYHPSAATVVPQLQKLLGDSDTQVVWRTARALGDYGSEAAAAVPTLRGLLAKRDSDVTVKYHSAAALGRIGDRSQETVNALIAAVGGDDPRVARVAVAALRAIKPDPQQALAALKLALKSSDKAVSVRALEAIVEAGERAVPLLKEALGDPATVYLACAAIEHIGPEAAGTAPELTKLLAETKHSQLITQALLALGSIGPAAKSASPQIVPLLEHSTDATVPVAAAYALGAIGDAQADGVLRAAVGKPNELLSMVASWSLAKIHPQDAQVQAAAKAKLQAGLTNKDPAIQAIAQKGLDRLNPPSQQKGPAEGK